MSHHFLRQELLIAVLTAAESKRGEGQIGSVACRASAALNALLGDHLIDRRGRCRSCRGPRGLLRRRRRICRVLVAASYYLHQPQEVLLAHLAYEMIHGRTAFRSAEDPPDPYNTPRTASFDLDATDMLAEVEDEDKAPPSIGPSSSSVTADVSSWQP